MMLKRTIELTWDEVKAAVAAYIAEHIEDMPDCHTAYEMHGDNEGNVTCVCKEEIKAG